MRYDPFTYQPMMRHFYEGSPLPQPVSKLAAENPDLSNHLNSVWGFSSWLKGAFPAMYTTITNQRPDLLDPVKAVTSGAMSPSIKGSKSGMSGLGDVVESGQETNIVSSWGRDLMDFGKSILAVKGQNDLMKLNIARAEKGLPPIDAGAVAPQVNVGISPQLQTLGTFALIGLVGVGLLAAMKR